MTENKESRGRSQSRISRRRLIQGGLAAAGLGAAAGVAFWPRSQLYKADYPEVPENRVRLKPNGKSVLIVGGGFGGMHAACELLDRGFSVTILEKSGLLGGKLKSWRDKSFGVPPADDPDFPGYPRDHGLHAVWGSYNNLREFMGRHDYRLFKFPRESTIYNYVGPDGLHFELGLSPSLGGYLGRLQSLLRTNRELKKLVGPDLDRMRGALFKMAAFDYSDSRQRSYLDGISFPEWARSVGMPEAAIYRLFGANSRMSMMDDIDNCSALSVLGLAALVSGHPDDMRVGTFTYPAGETYIDPIENYIKARGGEIIYYAPAIRLNREGSSLKSVTAGEEGAPINSGVKVWKCRSCGTAFYSPNPPVRCPVCGAEAAQILASPPRPVREYTADYYLLALDLPGARQVIEQSGLKGEPYFNKVRELQETSVYPANLWYANCDSWKKRFPAHADFFPSGFKHLGITLNLSHDGKAEGRKLSEPLIREYQNRGICVIETQIPNAARVKGLSDEMITRLVHEELKILMPDLPNPTDSYLNRWDNYSPQRVNDEARRPAIQSPLNNLLLIGDWVKTDRPGVYMEKTYIAAKLAVNLILDRIGRNEGRMTILPVGTPSAIIKTCQKLFSIYP